MPIFTLRWLLFLAVLFSLAQTAPLLFAQGSVTDAYNAVQAGIDANGDRGGGTLPPGYWGNTENSRNSGTQYWDADGRLNDRLAGDAWGYGGGGTGGNGGDESVNTGGRGGILVNPNGVLSRFTAWDSGRLSEQQLRIIRSSYTLPQDISAKSLMRCICLNRLEKAIIDAGGEITAEMWFLAGIQRITHVFYFPESKDIVIAGHAEGWFPGYEGAMIGVSTRQPVIELQDLVLALRTYAPGRGEWDGNVGCSIDPTEEGNVRLQQFVAQSRGLNSQAFANGVRQSIGMQMITVDGVPAMTNAARMMVAADYRMKLIGLGLDAKPYSRLETFIANTVPNASNALFRWYFVPDYKSVVLTEDRIGMELVGSGVKLVGENEIVSSDGSRTSVVGELDRGSRAFTQSFTRHYPQIAEKALVFAQLRNWIDMLICAAHIQREDFYGKSGWSMEFFGSEEKFPLEVYVAPMAVEPLVGQARRGNLLLTPVGGGVVIDAELALDEEHVKPDTDGKVATQRAKVGLNLSEGVWWWDVR
jgi:hypothetical protein